MKSAARTVFQNNELLRHLDGAGIDRVAQLAARRSYEQGATIFAEGDPADAIYGVISGQVQISARTSTGEEIVLDAYGSGRIFGLMAVFCQRQRDVTRLIIGEYAQRDIPARLAHRVLELTGVDPAGQSCLEITQAELAKFAFVSRQVVNHHLSDWQGRGWVATSPRRLRVTDREALLAVATSAGLGM